MSTTATKTTKHDPAIKKLLKRANYSESTELSDNQVEELNALAALSDTAPVSAIEKIVTGKAGGGSGKATARKVSVKYPEDVRAAYKRALELTGDPEHGGPKYPLTVKQTDAVKKALASKAKGDIAEANKALTDHATNAALKKIAKGQEAPKAATIAVRLFLKAHKALKDDRTMYARKGAAIILALREAE